VFYLCFNCVHSKGNSISESTIDRDRNSRSDSDSINIEVIIVVIVVREEIEVVIIMIVVVIVVSIVGKAMFYRSLCLKEIESLSQQYSLHVEKESKEFT